MRAFENIIVSLPFLKHLQLITLVRSDALDGDRWENFVDHLLTFNFIFQMDSTDAHPNRIESFRTPFWIEKKKWFISYYDSRLMSIPYFAPKSFTINGRIPMICSTSPNANLFYRNVRHLTVEALNSPIENFFESVEILTLTSPVDFYFATWNNRFRVLRFLSLPSMKIFLHIGPYLVVLPSLSTLQIDQFEGDLSFDSNDGSVYNNIRQLHINDFQRGLTHWKIEEIHQVFPRLEYVSFSNSMQLLTIIHIIHRFEQIQSVSFPTLIHSFDTEKTLEEEIRRLVWFCDKRKVDVVFDYTSQRMSVLIGSEVKLQFELFSEAINRFLFL